MSFGDPNNPYGQQGQQQPQGQPGYGYPQQGQPQQPPANYGYPQALRSSRATAATPVAPWVSRSPCPD